MVWVITMNASMAARGNESPMISFSWRTNNAKKSKIVMRSKSSNVLSMMHKIMLTLKALTKVLVPSNTSGAARVPDAMQT